MDSDQAIVVIQYPSLTQWLADRIAGAIATHQEFDTLEPTEYTQVFNTLHSPPRPPNSGGRSPKTRVNSPQNWGARGANAGLNRFHKRCVYTALEPMASVPPDFMPLPLFTPSGHSLGTFSSPLLLKLSRGEGAAAAQHLGIKILQTFAQHSNPEEFSPKLWIHPEGWLYADFDANNLAKFLQNLTTAKPTLLAFVPPKKASEISPSIISSDPALFRLQYAHARCYSLLRLGHQEKFLPPQDLEHYFRECGTSLWQTDSGELRIQTKSEQALLLALLQFPQSLSSQKVAYGCCATTVPGVETRVMWPLPQAHLRKQAIAWGQLFTNFYSDCRLFGDIQTHEPQLAQARFALIFIVKKVLAFFLEDILQMTAPLTL